MLIIIICTFTCICLLFISPFIFNSSTFAALFFSYSSLLVFYLSPSTLLHFISSPAYCLLSILSLFFPHFLHCYILFPLPLTPSCIQILHTLVLILQLYIRCLHWAFLPNIPEVSSFAIGLISRTIYLFCTLIIAYCFLFLIL